MHNFNWYWRFPMRLEDATQKLEEEFTGHFLRTALRKAKGDVEEASILAGVSLSEFQRRMAIHGVSLEYAGEIGDCYRSSARLVLQLFSEGIQEAKLVHGLPTLEVPPYTEHGHSWIEFTDLCVDTESGVSMPKSEYYALGHIDSKHCVRYSAEDILREVNTSGHWGPWAEKFFTTRSEL